MKLFYVFQGETYKEERTGGYVWSPQLSNPDKKGKRRKNAGYTIMTEIHESDYILHHVDGHIVAISVAKNDCYDAKQPKELVTATKSFVWDTEGYRVDLDYHDLDTPLDVSAYWDWIVKHYDEDSAFRKDGKGKLQYMCHIADKHAIFLLKQMIKGQTDKGLIELLKVVLDYLKDNDHEYSEEETDAVNEEIDSAVDDGIIPEWSGVRRPQATTVSKSTGRIKAKRDPNIASQAIKRAGYLCEYDNSDETFLRPNGKPYTEPHHLIPISKFQEFEYSLDVMENIVSLCSHCHNLLHYGRIEDKEKVLKKLYDDRKAALDTCGIPVTFEQLKSYYK